MYVHLTAASLQGVEGFSDRIAICRQDDKASSILEIIPEAEIVRIFDKKLYYFFIHEL